MPNARWSISIDDGEARAALQRLRDDIERTSQFVGSKSFKAGDVFSSGAQGGRQAADELASRLGVARSDVVSAVRQSNLLLGPGGQPVRFGGDEGKGGGPGGHGFESHSIGLQSVAHSARAVADTYTYRVSPAISEAHRAAAGFLAFSVPGIGALAAIGLSAATVIGVNLFGSFLKAREAAQELALASRAATTQGDVTGLEKIVKDRRADLVKVEDELARVSHTAVVERELGKRAEFLPEEFRIPGIILGGEQSKTEKEVERLKLEKSNAEELLGFYGSAALQSKFAVEQAKERNELARLGVTEVESGNKGAFDQAKARVGEQAKLVEGERSLRTARIKATAEFAEGEFKAGGLGLGEIQGVRRQAIEQERAEELAGANAEANKKRAELALQQAEIESQIRARQDFLATEGSRLTQPQRKKEELDIAERQAKARALGEQLGSIDAELGQKRQGIDDKATRDLGKNAQRNVEDALRQDEILFATKRSLGEATLQDELRRLEALIAATAAGSDKRLGLEKQHADTVKQLRDKNEAGALGVIGEAGDLLKSRGITHASPEQLGQAFDELGQKHQQGLDAFKAGGAVPIDDISRALRFQPQLRGLRDLGVAAGGVGGFLQGTAGEDADKAYWDRWMGERLKSGGLLPSLGAAPSLNFNTGAAEAGATPTWSSFVDGFDGAFRRINSGFSDLLRSMEGEAGSRVDVLATAIEDRVLARLRETLYRDLQRN